MSTWRCGVLRFPRSCLRRSKIAGSIWKDGWNGASFQVTSKRLLRDSRLPILPHSVAVCTFGHAVRWIKVQWAELGMFRWYESFARISFYPFCAQILVMSWIGMKGDSLSWLHICFAVMSTFTSKSRTLIHHGCCWLDKYINSINPRQANPEYVIRKRIETQWRTNNIIHYLHYTIHCTHVLYLHGTLYTVVLAVTVNADLCFTPVYID